MTSSNSETLPNNSVAAAEVDGSLTSFQPETARTASTDELKKSCNSFSSSQSLFYSTRPQTKGLFSEEQLGTLSPTFRDFAGTTRLSTSPPRKIADDSNNTYKKLTMKKSTPSPRVGEKSSTRTTFQQPLPPIQVNTEIRGTYNCEWSTTCSGQNSASGRSSLTSRSTQTSARKVDVSTCTINKQTDDLTSIIPPTYVQKLEDLEKITGHIVIQRFFTKTDHIFGSWIEKQLGMTTKTVAVDTTGLIQQSREDDFSRTTIQRSENDFSTSYEDDSYARKESCSSAWMEDFQKANCGNQIIKKKAPRDRSNIDEEILMELLRHVEKAPPTSLGSTNTSDCNKNPKTEKKQFATDAQEAKNIESQTNANVSESPKESSETDRHMASEPTEVKEQILAHKNTASTQAIPKNPEKPLERSQSVNFEKEDGGRIVARKVRSFSIVDESLGISPAISPKDQSIPADTNTIFIPHLYVLLWAKTGVVLE